MGSTVRGVDNRVILRHHTRFGKHLKGPEAEALWTHCVKRSMSSIGVARFGERRNYIFPARLCHNIIQKRIEKFEQSAKPTLL